MAVIQQQPTFNQQAASIAQQKQLAELLRKSADESAQDPNAMVGAGPYRHVVPVHPLAAALRGIESGVSAYMAGDAAKQQGQLEDRRLQATQDAFSGGQPDYQKLAGTGAVDASTLAKLLVDKQTREAEIQAKIAERQAKQNELTSGTKEALWASGGDEAQARQLLQNKMLLPVWGYNLNAQNTATDNTRQNQELEFRKQELEIRRQEAQRKLDEANKPKPLSDFQQYKMDEEQKVKDQARKQAEFSAQSVIDQADTLYNHPGRLAGTGMSSFVSKVPGTDAKGFASQLDTFKAQTFVPMVSALKGMGALSDAEGKKLSESVGALDPSMPEQEFADSLKNITNFLAKKAQISGLNVNIPKFADTGVNVDISPEAWNALTPEQQKQYQDDISKEQAARQQKPPAQDDPFKGFTLEQKAQFLKEHPDWNK